MPRSSLSIIEPDTRVSELESAQNEQPSEALTEARNSFRGILIGVVAGGLLWLGLIWLLIGSLLQYAHL